MISLRTELKNLGIDLPESSPLDALAKLIEQSPAKTSLGIVAASAVLFYRVERDFNPKVNDIYDALLYCATCLNVGYAEVHPRTPMGKIIGTILQTYGPALAARALGGLAANVAGPKINSVCREASGVEPQSLH